MRVCVAIIVFGACGKVESDPDASIDASPPDARIDAAPPIMPIESILAFPSPNMVVTDFENFPPGVTGAGFNLGFGGGAGNADAPVASPFMNLSGTGQTATFTFSTPLHAAGIAAFDGDYGNDNPVIITVAGYDNTGAMVGMHFRTLSPANDIGMQDSGAIFTGFRSAVTPFVSVRITIDQGNSTYMDNLMYSP